MGSEQRLDLRDTTFTTARHHLCGEFLLFRIQVADACTIGFMGMVAIKRGGSVEN